MLIPLEIISTGNSEGNKTSNDKQMFDRTHLTSRQIYDKT